MDRPSIPDSPLWSAYREIHDGLVLLRESAAAPKVFGAIAHGFRLNPPLPEAEVAAFETEHHVSLPADYRGFLIHLGNGGAGPAYGLFKLGEMDGGRGHARWIENNGFVGILAEPFPYADKWNDLTGKPEFDDAQALAQTNYEYDDLYGERLDEWEQKHYWNTRHVNGAIPICHLGCALREWLVVTGPEAGHVWCDRRVDDQGLYPLEIETTTRVTFLRWYRSWLDDALKHLSAGD